MKHLCTASGLYLLDFSSTLSSDYQKCLCSAKSPLGGKSAPNYAPLLSFIHFHYSLINGVPFYITLFQSTTTNNVINILIQVSKNTCTCIYFSRMGIDESFRIYYLYLTILDLFQIGFTVRVLMWLYTHPKRLNATQNTKKQKQR